MTMPIGYYLSFAAGLVLIVICAMGIRAFAPRIKYGSDPASRVFAIAICLGFAAAAGNSAYWQIAVKIVEWNDLATYATMRNIGFYCDVVFKGASAVSVYLHMKSWHMTLPAAERRRYSVLGMTLYPDTTKFLSRMLNGFAKKSD
jgi:hypothetical protein